MSAGSQEQGAHLLPSPVPGQGEEGRSGDFTGAPTGVPRLPCCAHTPQEAGRLLPGCNAGAQVEATSHVFIPGPLEAPIPSFCWGFFMQTLKYTPLIFFFFAFWYHETISGDKAASQRLRIFRMSSCLLCPWPPKTCHLQLKGLQLIQLSYQIEMTRCFFIGTGQKGKISPTSRKVKVILVKLGCQHLPEIRPYFESITCMIIKVNLFIKLYTHTCI